jgi:hypothetical protein
VSNLLFIRPRVTPSELKKQIEQALVRTAELDAKRITVDVDGRKVILKGTVRYWAEKKEAERQAWLAPDQRGNRKSVPFSVDSRFAAFLCVDFVRRKNGDEKAHRRSGVIRDRSCFRVVLRGEET